ncbi:DUF2891 domain-containing protein, partial [Burkholderia gladioli]
RFQRFLPKAIYPIRAGTHHNTAFAVRLALDYTSNVHCGARSRTTRARCRRSG